MSFISKYIFEPNIFKKYLNYPIQVLSNSSIVLPYFELSNYPIELNYPIQVLFLPYFEFVNKYLLVYPM